MERRSTWGCLAVLTILACTAPQAPRATPFDAQGHRGARGLLPENTLPAFRRALELGVSTLELDVGITRDGVAVVAHDPAVSAKICQHRDGTPIRDDHGPLLRDLTLAELRAYDCGSLNPDRRRFPEPPREARPGEAIPTLSEVFALAAQGPPGVRFNVETKIAPGDAHTIPADAFVDVVLAEVRRHGLEERVSIQSFDWRTLARVRQQAPEIETVALVAPDTLDPSWLNGLVPDPDDPLALFRAARPFVDVVSPHWRMLTDGGPALPLGALQAEGFTVVPWTVNDERTMRRLLRLGVDGLISDYPDRLLALLRAESVPIR